VRVSSFSPALLPFFNFLFLSKKKRSAFFLRLHKNFYTRALSSTSVIQNTSREKKAAREYTHTHRKVRPRTPSRVRFRAAFLPVFILFPEEREREREERFDFDRKDEASSRLWQPPSLRFEFCGSLSSIEKFLTHTFFSLTRAKETASAEEREKEEEERKSRASNFIFLPSFIVFLQALLLRVFGDLFTNLSTLSLSQKRQVYGKWTKSSNKREQNNFFVD